MDKLINTDKTGGFPFKSNDVRFILGQISYDAGLYNAVTAILKAFGDNFILYGCDFDGSGNVNPGWIFLDGEILKVDFHACFNNRYFTKQTTEQTTRNYKDGSTYNVHQLNRGVANGMAGNVQAGNDNHRLKNKVFASSNNIIENTGSSAYSDETVSDVTLNMSSSSFHRRENSFNTIKHEMYINFSIGSSNDYDPYSLEFGLNGTYILPNDKIVFGKVKISGSYEDVYFEVTGGTPTKITLYRANGNFFPDDTTIEMWFNYVYVSS